MDAASRCLVSPLPKEAPIPTGNVKNARMNKGAGLDTAASTLLVHLSTMFDEPIQMLDCLQSNLEWMGEGRKTLQFRPCHSSHYEPTITHMSEMGWMLRRRRELEQQVLVEIQKKQNTPEQEAILRCFDEILGVFIGSPAKALLWTILLGFEPSFP